MPMSSEPELSKRILDLESELSEVKGSIHELTQKFDSLKDVVLDQAPAISKTISVSNPVSQDRGSTVRPPSAGHRPPQTQPSWKRSNKKKSTVSLGSSEQWINRIGIGLLLFGLVFLFKYSIDKGWLTPAIRLVFGGSLGVALCGMGLKLKTSRQLGNFLLGGGIAAFFITLFAGYQLYDLIPYAFAFGGMILTTLASYYFAVSERSVISAIIATVGGLATPFLLYTDDGNISALVVYICLITAGAISVYMQMGWRSLLAVAFFGGWLGLLAGWTISDIGSLFGTSPDGSATHRMVFQIGIVFTLFVVGAIPIARAYLQKGDPDKWKMAPLRSFARIKSIQQPAYLFAFLAPLFAIGETRMLWDMDGWLWLCIYLIAALIYAGSAHWLRGKDELTGASVLATVAAVLVSVAWTRVVENSSYNLVFFAAEGALLVWMSQRIGYKGLWWLGHAFLAGVILMIPDQIGGSKLDPPLLNIKALCTLATAGLLFSAGRIEKRKQISLVYYYLSYGTLLLVLMRELSRYDNGQALVTVAWGLCGIALIFISWRYRNRLVRLTGLGTLLLVLAKLFVVDLATLDAGYRILLFLGLGATLLSLSYFFPQLWRVEDHETNSNQKSSDKPLT